MEQDHPTMTGWTVEQNGAVLIPAAGIVSYTEDQSNVKLNCGISVSHNVPLKPKKQPGHIIPPACNIEAWISGLRLKFLFLHLETMPLCFVKALNLHEVSLKRVKQRKVWFSRSEALL